MNKKIADLEAQLSELTHERDDLDAKIEEMIADMTQANLADAPPEQRKTGDWAPNGARTRKYLELTNRQAAVEKDIIDLSRQIAADGKPALPN
jgi:hypothetical protein